MGKPGSRWVRQSNALGDWCFSAARPTRQAGSQASPRRRSSVLKYWLYSALLLPRLGSLATKNTSPLDLIRLVRAAHLLAELLEGAGLELSNSLPRNVTLVANFLESLLVAVVESEA